MAPTKRAYNVLKNKRTIELMASKLENGNIGRKYKRWKSNQFNLGDYPWDDG